MKDLIVKNTLIGLVALAASGIAAQSYADSGFYIGGSVSQNFVDENGIDEDDTGGKIFGGYKFNKYVGIEGAYYDIGEISDNNSQLELDGISLAVVGSLPVSSRFSLFGKIGVHDWDAEASGPVSGQLSTDSDTDGFYGIGVSYAVSSSWHLRGELERYEVEDIDVDVVSFGVSYNF